MGGYFFFFLIFFQQLSCVASCSISACKALRGKKVFLNHWAPLVQWLQEIPAENIEENKKIPPCQSI